MSPEYKVSIEGLSSIAIITMQIPDLSDPDKRAQLPPSQHKPLAAAMLKGCAQLEDPLAVMQIMTAVYLADLTGKQNPKMNTSHFTQSDITTFRKTLDTLSTKSNSFDLGPEVLTLRGLFLELAGQKLAARKSYELAIQRGDFGYHPSNRHPMQLPLTTPWNALGYLLKRAQDPQSHAEAKSYFAQGALQGDDPLSYYELAQFYDRTDTLWLQYTSKAAASGHRQAAVDLADFYQEVSTLDSPILRDNVAMRKALAWLRTWRRDSTGVMAREWLRTASIVGDRASTVRLAEIYEKDGDREGAEECWKRVEEEEGQKGMGGVRGTKRRVVGSKSSS